MSEPKPLLAKTGWTVRHKLLVCACIATIAVGGGYMAFQQGWLRKDFGTGSKAASPRLLSGKDQARFRQLENRARAGGPDSLVAAEQIISKATEFKTASRLSLMPEVDQAVSTAATALLISDGNVPQLAARQERARFALSLIDVPEFRVLLAQKLLHKASQNSEISYLVGTIRSGLQDLPQSKQDIVRSDIARFVATSNFNNALDTAFMLSVEIVDPILRSKTLHEVALLRLASTADRSAPAKAADLRQAKADSVLMMTASVSASKSKILPATILALSIGDVASRDRMLRLVVSDASRKVTRWQLIPALMGISDTKQRDEALLRYVYRATNDGYAHEARQAAAAITDRSLKMLSHAVLAEYLANLGYDSQVSEVLPSLIDIQSLSSGQRDIAAGYAAVTLAKTDRIDAAVEALEMVTRPNRISSKGAVAVAESLSRDIGKFDQIDGLLRFSDNENKPNISARAAIALAREGNLIEATNYIDEISASDVRLKAAVLFALEIKAPKDWLARMRAEAPKVSSTSVDLYGLQAGLAAAMGSPDDSMQLLMFATDELLITRVGTEIARQLALKGRIQDINQLVLIAPQGKAGQKDSFLRAGALALADTGSVDRAAYLARDISDYKVRTAAMRSIARLAAHDADAHQALDGQIQEAPQAAALSILEDPVVRRHSFNIFDVKGADLGSRLPTLPNAAMHTAASVQTTVPPTGSTGRPAIAIVPLANNGFNKKFLTARQFEEVVPGGPTIVMRAQNSSYPVYLHIDHGVIDLPTLHQLLIEQGYGDFLVKDGRTYTLRVPLFVSTAATLVISDADADELRLSGERVSYIVSAGKVYFSGVQVSAWSEEKNSPINISEETKYGFRPFYIAWSNSETNVVQSRFFGLGYSSGKAYGFSFSNGPLSLMSVARVVKEPRGSIIDSSFEGMLYGFYSWEAADVKLVGNEYRNNLTYGIDPHDWSKRLLVAYNTAYGSQAKHGIIGSRHVEDSWFLGNLSFSNHGSGLMMDRYSGRNILYANTSFDNGGSGIAIYESPCNIVSSNKIFRNSGNGIMFRNSWDVGIFGNEISRNGKLGINGFTVRFVTKPGAPARNLELDPYERFVTSSIARNVLNGNKQGGIGVQAMGSTMLRSNTIIGDAKRAYIGDLRNVEFDIVRQSNRGLVIGGSCPKPKIVYSCGFVGQGYLSDQLMAAANARPVFSTCPPDTTVDAKSALSTPTSVAGAINPEITDDDNDGGSPADYQPVRRLAGGTAR